jgi:hypothetical protein
VRSSAEVESREPDALALRMGKHFGHKVRVETEGAVTRVHTRFGAFELEPVDTILRIRTAADDAESLERLEEVVASHLGRFARGEELAVRWTRAD